MIVGHSIDCRNAAFVDLRRCGGLAAQVCAHSPRRSANQSKFMRT